ncbi:hypothetical protein UVI_02051470 [Ustilaginoidea virens]|nr:hypothetical protein UVI_02051470 [Ustilaginoidea virens]
MAAAFRPVNSLIEEPIKEETTTTTTTTTTSSSSSATPRPRPVSRQARLRQSPSLHDDSKTPTRATFNVPLDQKALPDASLPPLPDAKDMPRRQNSQHSSKSSKRDSMEIDVDDSDGERGATGEDGAASDAESVNADGSKSSRKKKSQRFYCTEYPPCNLSFTRSEHLARHIR